MPYVKRDERGQIVAVSLEPAEGFDEQLPDGSPELADMLADGEKSLAGTDQDFIRVLEDVVDLLIDKGVFLFTDLPESAQQKILKRQRLRHDLDRILDLIGDD